MAKVSATCLCFSLSIRNSHCIYIVCNNILYRKLTINLASAENITTLSAWIILIILHIYTLYKTKHSLLRDTVIYIYILSQNGTWTLSDKSNVQSPRYSILFNICILLSVNYNCSWKQKNYCRSIYIKKAFLSRLLLANS